MAEPTCSVVVCTYNRLKHLQECVESLLVLDYFNYEIIVVDDGSIDGTAEYLSQIENEKVRVVRHEKNRGVSASRNSGILAAQSDIIAFTDDDCRPEMNWLKNLVLPLDDPEMMFVIGRTEYVKTGYVGYFPERLVKNPQAHWPMVGNMAYRKKVFSEIGLFDDAYFKNVNEDTEMGIRAVANGYKFARVLDAVVYHQAAVWNFSSLLKSARNASSWVRLATMHPKHHDFFGSHVSLGFVIDAKDYLLIFLFPLIVPVLFLRYLKNGKRDFAVFFAKWPCYLFLKRYYIYKEAILQRKFYL